MKKRSLSYLGPILFAVITVLLFSSCDNFMQGSLIKEELDKSIKYANSSYLTVTLNADAAHGTTVPVATMYKTHISQQIKKPSSLHQMLSISFYTGNLILLNT